MVCVNFLEQTLQLSFFLPCALEVDQEADEVALELGGAMKVLKVLLHLDKVILTNVIWICHLADPFMLKQLLGRVACGRVLIQAVR